MPSKYQRLKERAHSQVCEWMRLTSFTETASAQNLRLCALSFFKRRHNLQPLYKRATKPHSQKKMISDPGGNRRMAISLIARAEIVETYQLLS